jgi:hypothetical protein
VLDDVGEVHIRALGDLALGAGQHEQPVQQPLVATVDLQQRLPQLPYLEGRGPPVHGDLQQRPVERQRRTQLVRGVGHEPALAVEGPVEPFQHHVERVGQPLHLVVRAVQRDPFVQATVGRRRVGDPARGVGHALQRLEQPAGDEPAQRGRRDAGQDQRYPTLGEQRVERVVPGVADDLRLELAAELGRFVRRRSHGRLHRTLERRDSLAGVRYPLRDQRVRDAEQQHAGDEEEPAVDERQAGTDGHA